MDRHHSRDGGRLTALVAACSMVFAVGAHAETGSANAKDISVHINLLGVAQLDIDPQAPAGFQNAVDATYQTNLLPSFDSGGTLLHLSTGTITSEAQYVPGVSFSIAGADVELQNVDLSAVDALGNPLIALTADVIRSQSAVMGYCLPAGRQQRTAIDDIMFFSSFDNGNLFAGGDGNPSTGDDVSFNGLGISILGIPVPNIPEVPPPNTSIDLGQLGIVGATLILNERTLSGDGTTSLSLSTNAVHLALNVAGLVTADVVFAHSDSTLDCTQ
jgi:hypothetical protein